MRFQVPQNIDITDKILFGLDFKQLLYLCGAAGLFVFLFLFTGTIVAILFGVPIVLFALLLSFFSLNNQSFVTIFQATIRFFMNKKMYIWKQEKGETYVERRGRQKSSADGEVKKAGDPDLKRIGDLNANLIFDDSPSDDGVDVRI